MKSMLIPLRCPQPCLEDTKTPSQRKRTWLVAPLVWSALAIFAANLAQAEDSPVLKTKDVILVHGAWADGSSWSKVIPLLERRGFHVTAVQLPLTSVAEDVATVNRAIALDPGPRYSLCGSLLRWNRDHGSRQRPKGECTGLYLRVRPGRGAIGRFAERVGACHSHRGATQTECGLLKPYHRRNHRRFCSGSFRHRKAKPWQSLRVRLQKSHLRRRRPHPLGVQNRRGIWWPAKIESSRQGLRP